MPDPDALELPEANDLYPVVCDFMHKLNVRASLAVTVLLPLSSSMLRKRCPVMKRANW